MQLVSHISLFDVKWFKYIYKTKTSYLPHPHIPYILHIYIYIWLLNYSISSIIFWSCLERHPFLCQISSSHHRIWRLLVLFLSQNKFTFSRIIMYMCQTGSVYVSCVLMWCVDSRQAGRTSCYQVSGGHQSSDQATTAIHQSGWLRWYRKICIKCVFKTNYIIKV